MRISEALSLSRRDPDFGRCRVRVRRRAYEGKLDAPKSRVGHRNVPVPKATIQALWKRLGSADDDALVFPGRDGKVMHSSTPYRILKTAGKAGGLPHVNQHMLRHSVATALFNRHGWNAVQVQRFLGHHSPAFTLSRYVHLLEGDMPESPFEGYGRSDDETSKTPGTVVVEEAG
jgi:integrase